MNFPGDEYFNTIRRS